MNTRITPNATPNADMYATNSSIVKRRFGLEGCSVIPKLDHTNHRYTILRFAATGGGGRVLRQRCENRRGLISKGGGGFVL